MPQYLYEVRLKLPQQTFLININLSIAFCYTLDDESLNMYKNYYLIGQIQQKVIGMQVQTWRKSVNPPDEKLNPDTVNAITDNLLGYKFNSQFYLNVPDRSQLNIILFLCLYNSKVMKGKKTTTALGKMNQYQLKQLEDQFFNTHSQSQLLDIPSRIEQASAKFEVHEKLIKDNAKVFEALSLNSLFDHEYYKNKIQVREFADNKLVPFKNITFNQRLQVRNDIVIISYQTGYWIAAYSTNKQADNRDSYLRPKKESKKQEQQVELGQEQNLEGTFDVEESKEKQQLKKNSEGQQEGVIEQQKYNPQSAGEKKQELITFFALIAALGFFAFEAYSKIYG